jgi:hypothetical protein
MTTDGIMIHDDLLPTRGQLVTLTTESRAVKQQNMKPIDMPQALRRDTFQTTRSVLHMHCAHPMSHSSSIVRARLNLRQSIR